MNSKMWLVFGSTVAALCAGAAEFPGAGGDIASNGADGWNGAKPGSGEEAKFTKAGTYTASDNVTFGSVNFAVDGLVFDLTAGKKTVTLSGSAPVADGASLANATTQLKGGSWTGKDMTFKKMGSGYTLWLSDGATLTDTGIFSPGFGLAGNLIKLTGGSKVNAVNMRLHEWGSTGTKLDVGEGSQVVLSGSFIGEANATAGNYGGHWMDVHDSGSLFSVAGDLSTAFKTTDFGVRVRDGAELTVKGTTKIGVADAPKNAWLEVLNGATGTVQTLLLTSLDGRVSVSNATLSATKINIGGSAAQTGNRVSVLDGATATVGEVIFSGSDGSLLVSNATCVATTGFQLGYTAGAKGNTCTVTGPQAVFSCAGNVFGYGCGNVFELANGATWQTGGISLNLMGGTSNNVLRVIGGATFSNKSDPAGDNNFYLYGTDNRIEVTDGGIVDVERFFVWGTGNRIVVSNGTLKASSTAGYGIWMRDGGSHMLVVRGTTPSVQLNEFKSSVSSGIRFEVPADGYADGFVPVTARVLSPGSTATEKFEIECAAWAANPDATSKLVLVRCTEAISAANAAWILAQNPNLPENVKLKVKGGDVILYKPEGLVLTVR